MTKPAQQVYSSRERRERISDAFSFILQAFLLALFGATIVAVALAVAWLFLPSVLQINALTLVAGAGGAYLAFWLLGKWDDEISWGSSLHLWFAASLAAFENWLLLSLYCHWLPRLFTWNPGGWSADSCAPNGFRTATVMGALTIFFGTLVVWGGTILTRLTSRDR